MIVFQKEFNEHVSFEKRQKNDNMSIQHVHTYPAYRELRERYMYMLDIAIPTPPPPKKKKKITIGCPKL